LSLTSKHWQGEKYYIDEKKIYPSTLPPENQRFENHPAEKFFIPLATLHLTSRKNETVITMNIKFFRITLLLLIPRLITHFVRGHTPFTNPQLDRVFLRKAVITLRGGSF